MSVGYGVFCGVGLLAGWIGAQPPPLSEAEARAQAEVQALRTGGFVAVQPWAQLMGTGKLGVGWLTSGVCDGAVEWTQDAPGVAAQRWQQAWLAEDGLKQVNGTSQRAVIDGYDPSKPLLFRAVSHPVTTFKPYKVTFGEAVASQERRLPALTHPDGKVSFIVFNDVHNRYQNFPLLTAKAGAAPDFAVLNGDVLQDPQSEKELADHLLLPMAWFAARSLPCFFLRGNHETRGAFARPMKRYLLLPENRYYAAMTFGAARVLFLDSGEDKPDASAEYSGLVDFDPYIEEELAWLKREIASEAFKQATWRIAVVHIPPDWRKEEAELWHGERRMRERFAPLFDAGQITAVISGHNHRAELIEPCQDKSRGFQWPVFIGGAPALTNATVIRVDADAQALKITRIHSDGTVGAEKTWTNP